jgi:hypothetical protein
VANLKKKNVKAKPTGPVEDTVFYTQGWESGVGVFVRMGNNPMMPDQMIIRRTACISSQDPTKIRLDGFQSEISVGSKDVMRCSAAYVYGWIQMQKNLIEFRKGKKKA